MDFLRRGLSTVVIGTQLVALPALATGHTTVDVTGAYKRVTQSSGHTTPCTSRRECESKAANSPGVSIGGLLPSGVKFMSRKSWDPGFKPSPGSHLGTPTRITVHNTETPRGVNAVGALRGIVQDHLTDKKRKLGKLGYHILIGPDGTIYEGTPLGEQGAHEWHQNAGNIGIAFLDDLRTVADKRADHERASPQNMPTDAEKRSLRIVLAALQARFKSIQSVGTHSETAFHQHSSTCGHAIKSMVQQTEMYAKADAARGSGGLFSGDKSMLAEGNACPQYRAGQNTYGGT